MRVTITAATEEGLRDRAAWRYEAPYDFYDDDGEPVKNPERFFEVREDDGELVGFYYFERRGDALFYGLGLRPDLTGSGVGLEFVRTGLEFASKRYRPARVILDVAEFNARARIVYERAGFRVIGRHMRGEVPFVDMELAP